MKKSNNYRVYTRTKTGSPDNEIFIYTVDDIEIDGTRWVRDTMAALHDGNAKKKVDQDGILIYHVLAEPSQDNQIIPRTPFGYDGLFGDQEKLLID